MITWILFYWNCPWEIKVLKSVNKIFFWSKIGKSGQMKFIFFIFFTFLFIFLFLSDI